MDACLPCTAQVIETRMTCIIWFCGNATVAQTRLGNDVLPSIRVYSMPRSIEHMLDESECICPK
jgi:hypothetical protein